MLGGARREDRANEPYVEQGIQLLEVVVLLARTCLNRDLYFLSSHGLFLAN